MKQTVFSIFLCCFFYIPGISQSDTSATVLMVGNSITFQGNWKMLLGREDVVNWGIPGYTTEQLSWTVKNYIRLHPAIIFLEGGINDLTLGISPERVFQNQVRVLDTLIARGIIPVVESTIYQNPSTDDNIRVKKLNALLSEYCHHHHIDYLDLNSVLSKDGFLKKELTIDGTHLRPEAYVLWARLVREELNKLPERPSAHAGFRVAGILGSHMVVQRNKPFPVWGRAMPGVKVSVVFHGQKRQAAAGADSAWSVTFPAMKAGGPFDLEVAAGDGQRVVLSDILVGEVWLCSGQSNMEFRLGQASTATEDLPRATNGRIRHFRVPNNLSLRPENDIPPASWQVCSPENAGDFTAVGYYFAQRLYDSLRVPIGLVNATWGGSQIEGWISRDALLTDKELGRYAVRMPDNWAENFQRKDQLMKEHFFVSTGLPEISTKEDILTPNYDFSHWPVYGGPGNWDWMWQWSYRGQLWMETDVDIPDTLVAKESEIHLGSNDSRTEVYINGRPIYEGRQLNTIIALPGGVWAADRNRLIVRQGEQREPQWMGMGIHGQVDRVYIGFGDEKIQLGGRPWRPLPDLSAPYRFVALNNSEASILYNGMIRPIIAFPLRGVIWYQGEANTMRAAQYADLFPLLIGSWRKERGGELPFYFVQLASNGSDRGTADGSEWAELREAQQKSLLLPHTGMAVTIDAGDSMDIHPRNKRVPGERLAAIALAGTYKYAVPFSGPTYRRALFTDTAVTIFFEHTGGRLTAGVSGGSELHSFTVGDSQQHFYQAAARIEQDRVIVTAPRGIIPVSVRYAWKNSPMDANCYNPDGFPAAPFRTDNWPGLTQNRSFDTIK